VPYFEPPSKPEDANSPVGPLQHHVSEPYLDEWKHIDWRALDLGSDTPVGMYIPESSHNDAMGVALSPYFNDAMLGGSDGLNFDFGQSLYPAFHIGSGRLDAPDTQ
jgi:hypothetical protein